MSSPCDGTRTAVQASPQHPRRVVRLDGVRAIAALSVVFFHVWLYRADRPHGPRTELLDQVLFYASNGLICFFVLSGYLLYGAFARAALTGGDGVALGPYLRRRAARIVPAAWVCGAGCLVLYHAVGYGAITPSADELPFFALFLQNYSLETMGRLNPVTWTLGVEIAFYAVLPLIGWLALRIGPRRVRAQVLLVFALIAITPVWNLLVLERGWDAVAAKALPAYLGSFGIGMLVAVWARWRSSGGRVRGSVSPAATAVLVVGAVLVIVADATWAQNGWWLKDGIFSSHWLRPSVQVAILGHLGMATGFALLIGAAACGSGPAAAWLGWRPLAALGTISYGLYLWHLPLLIVAREAGLLPGALAPRALVVLALSVAAASASWRWIERPWIEHRWVRRGERPRLPARPATAAESAG
jgi:peptidoglycan/LPS O-acetylase OafA/YrhL